MKNFWAVQKMIWTTVLSVVMFSLNGCVYLVVGGVGALGGYVVSPDTVEGTIVTKNYDEVWTTSVEILSNMGMIEEKNEFGGVITARIQGARVQVNVFRIGNRAAKLTVKSRKMMFPKIKVSQDVYVRIAGALG